MFKRSEKKKKENNSQGDSSIKEMNNVECRLLVTDRSKTDAYRTLDSRTG